MLMNQNQLPFYEPIRGKLKEGRKKAFNRKGNLLVPSKAKVTA